MEEATTLLKVLTRASAGRKLTSYVSFITGPSSTTDIEKEFITGVHGPEEVYIIILDNGRLALAENEDFHEILYCLKCGGCMLVCPVFLSVGGHVFGGPVYPGGIGTLLTAMTDSVAESAKTLAFCADCKKCEDFCPVGIPTGELLVKIKTALGPSAAEKALSSLFRRRVAAAKGVSLLARVQKLWQKNGHLRSLPFAWTRGKRLPLLKPQKEIEPVRGNAGKVYVFQGCLVKYFFPEVREGVLKTLRHLGFTAVLPDGQACCGAPSLHLGDTKTVRALAEQNLRSFEEENPDYILTVCPTGHGIFKNLYPKLDSRALRWRDKVVDFTAFVADRRGVTMGSRARQDRLYYHYPCHYLTDLKLGTKPTRLLNSLGFEITAAKDPPSCCGFCGVFSYHHPAISAHLWKNKKREIEESRASLVATDCPGCLFQLRAGLAEQHHPVRSYHTAEILAALIDQEGLDGDSRAQKSGKASERPGQINQ
jgi:Fe-S oxidoreductase